MSSVNTVLFIYRTIKNKGFKAQSWIGYSQCFSIVGGNNILPAATNATRWDLKHHMCVGDWKKEPMVSIKARHKLMGERDWKSA